MNEKICKTIVEHKSRFVPHLFTERQVQLIQNWLERKKMTATEQTYLYATVTKKVDALTLVQEEFYVLPQGMIPDRIVKAKELLKKITKPAFISGSFLFSEKYNDIDIFIISGRRKELYKENVHYIYLKERDLEKPTFQSAALSSVSNFNIILPPLKTKKLHLGQTMNAYQEVVINLLEGKEFKNVKGILSDYSFYLLKKILTSYELNSEYKKIIKRKDQLQLISDMVKELLIKNFDKRYLLSILKRYIKMLNDDINNIKLNDHLKIYKKTYGEIINECKQTAN